MGEVWSWILASALVLTSDPSAMAQSVAFGPREPNPVITIRVVNDAKIDRETGRRAQNVAARIFRKAAVEIRWVDAAPFSQNLLEAVEEPRLLDATEIELRILSPATADRLSLPGNVMGLAPGAGPDRERVYVFYGRVKELAFRQVKQHCERTIARPATVEQILGAMIAHELGHILLDLPSHSATGIMRGNWDQKDLHDVAYEDLLFTPQQCQAIRAEVVRRACNRRAVEAAARGPAALAR